MEMLRAQHRQHLRHQAALEERERAFEQGPDAVLRQYNARRERARIEVAEASRSVARAWAEQRAEAQAALRPNTDNSILGPALIHQKVQASNKEPIRPRAARGGGGGIKAHALTMLRRTSMLCRSFGTSQTNRQWQQQQQRLRRQQQQAQMHTRQPSCRGKGTEGGMEEGWEPADPG